MGILDFGFWIDTPDAGTTFCRFKTKYSVEGNYTGLIFGAAYRRKIQRGLDVILSAHEARKYSQKSSLFKREFR